MKKAFRIVLVVFLTLVAVVFLTVALAFNSKDHSEYDSPQHPTTGTRASESAEHVAAARLIAAGTAEPPQVSRSELLLMMRKQMDERGEALHINSEIRPVNDGGIRAEWVIAPMPIPRAGYFIFMAGVT